MRSRAGDRLTSRVILAKYPKPTDPTSQMRRAVYVKRKINPGDAMRRKLVPALLLGVAFLHAGESAKYEYKTLATSKTSTMEKEMNEAAQAGFVFMSVMGGETAF